MTPKSYTIGNFKAIGPPQTLELRPITLIFGKNSAGKSSVIQSLLLCRHAMEKRTFEFTSTKRWGQTIDLGGFRHYVHRHEADRDMEIGFTFERSELEKSNTPLESAVERLTTGVLEDGVVPPWSFSFFNFVSEISVSFSVGLPSSDLGLKDRRTPRVKAVRLALDGEPILTFALDQNGQLSVSEVKLDGTSATLAIAHLAQRYFASQSENEAEEDMSLKILAEELGNVPLESNAFQEYVGNAVKAYDSLVAQGKVNEPLLDLVADTEPFARILWNVAAKLPEELRTPGRALVLGGRGLALGIPPRNRLPTTRLIVQPSEDGSADTGTEMGSAVQVEALEDLLLFFLDDPGTTDHLSALAKAFRFDLELLVESVFETLGHWLLGTEYIGPYRSIPGRYFQIAESDDSNEIDQGYRSLREIANKPDLLRSITNLFQDTLDCPYRLEVRTVAPSLDVRKLEEALQRELEFCKKDPKRDARAEVGKVLASHADGKETKGVYLVDSRNETDVDFCDVGFGIGQVLPLIAEVASERVGLVCIEQPEVHLHPQMQSNLADIFLQRKGGAGNSSSLYILETHSEHLILRLLRRIRETTRGKLPEELQAVDASRISVVWVEADKDGSLFTSLAVNSQGRFVDDWPAGFFEERLEEMF